MSNETQEFANFEIELGDDFQNTNAWGGELRPVPPVGTYQLTVVNIENKPIGNNTPAVVVTFTIGNAEDTSLNDTKVWNNYPLTAKAMGRLKQFMIAGGGSLSKFNAEEYLGVTIMGDITHSMGDAKIGPDGTPMEARVFANVCNERPMEAAAVAETPATPPPVTRGNKATAAAAAAAKPANGAARRA